MNCISCGNSIRNGILCELCSKTRGNPHTVNIHFRHKELKLALSGLKMEKIDIKEKVIIIPKTRKGNELKRVALDVQTDLPVRWYWAFKTYKGKKYPAEDIQYYQRDPDTGKERKVSLEEPNIGPEGEVGFIKFMPKDNEEKYIISEIYEIISDKPKQIKRLYKIAKFLIRNDSVGLTSVVFRRGMTQHGGILTSYINKKNKTFGLLLKLTNTEFTPSLMMKIPRKGKIPEKIKRKDIW